MRSRWKWPALALAVTMLVAVVAWLAWPSGRRGSDGDDAASSSPADDERALNRSAPSLLNAVLNAPLPPGKGELRIRGRVVDGKGPVANARVTATRGTADDTLS